MIKVFLKRFGIFIFLLAWFLSGWPVIWQNPRIPPKIQEAQAAITVTQVSQVGTTSGATTQTVTTFTPAINSLYLLWTIQTNSVADTTPTVACANGLTMVQVNTRQYFTNATPLKRITLFRGLITSGGTNNTCTITWGETPTGMGYVVVKFDGVNTSGTNGSGAIAQSVVGSTDNAAAATGLTLTLAALQAGSTTAGGFSNEVNSASSISAGTNYTIGTGVAFNSPTTSLRVEWYTTGSTTVNVTQSATADIGGIALEVKVAPLTTLGDGASEPSNVTIGPGAGVTDLDNFTLQTNTGTDTVTAATVTLGPANAYNNIAQVDITDTSNVAKCTAVANPTSNTITFSSCSISVTTAQTTYKVRITPKTHANMPGVPGASYATTAIVTSFTSTNTASGTDSGSATVTVDNLSPNSATNTGGASGNAQVTFDWTTSNSSDFSRSVVLRWSGSSAGSEVPLEGQDYSVDDTTGTATVACVRTADASSTPVSGTDGGGTGGCSSTPLTNGQAYTYKVFQKDSNGNYDSGANIGTFTPVLISVTITTDGTISYGLVAPSASKSTIQLADTQTVKNDGSATENFNIKTSDATGGTQWTLGTTPTPGPNVFVHEFSTNGGSSWTPFETTDVYQTLATGVLQNGTRNFDLRITAPTSSDAVQKTITITVQATQ